VTNVGSEMNTVRWVISGTALKYKPSSVEERIYLSLLKTHDVLKELSGQADILIGKKIPHQRMKLIY